MKNLNKLKCLYKFYFIFVLLNNFKKKSAVEKVAYASVCSQFILDQAKGGLRP